MRPHDGQMLAAPTSRRTIASATSGVEASFSSLLAIPVRGEQAELVLVFFDEPHAFSRDDLELAQQVARAARGAFERSRLFDAERTARSLCAAARANRQPARDRARPGSRARRRRRGGGRAAACRRRGARVARRPRPGGHGRGRRRLRTARSALARPSVRAHRETSCGRVRLRCTTTRRRTTACAKAMRSSRPATLRTSGCRSSAPDGWPLRRAVRLRPGAARVARGRGAGARRARRERGRGVDERGALPARRRRARAERRDPREHRRRDRRRRPRRSRRAVEPRGRGDHGRARERGCRPDAGAGAAARARVGERRHQPARRDHARGGRRVAVALRDGDARSDRRRRRPHLRVPRHLGRARARADEDGLRLDGVRRAAHAADVDLRLRADAAS